MNDVENLIYRSIIFSNPRNIALQFKSRQNDLLPNEYWEELSKIKKRAVASSNQLVAKVAWCFETIGRIQDKFVASYNQIKNKNFYDAWCSLERCEIEISFLDKHFNDKHDDFGIEHIRKYVTKFQSLFPYKTFISPGFTGKRRCSICNELITPRNQCEHENGEIYDGEPCSAVVTDMTLLEISLTDNPVQKYSVIDIVGREYSFPLLEYLPKIVSSPWELWDYEICKKTVSKYSKVGRNELCPCGSGLKYKKCCLKEKKEEDHYEFILN